MQVSVVIPCLNEANSVGICIDKALAAFRDHGIRGEVVVADNGSTDGSMAIAKEHGARVVHAAVKGYGSAIRRGIEEACGDFIILGDADGSHDFSEIPNFVSKWREGNDYILGSRMLGEIKYGAMRWHHRHLGTPVLSALISIFFGVRITDMNSGMRGIARKLAHQLDLRTNGFELCSESLIKAAKMGAHIAEIPITTWPEQRDRAPHLNTFRDGWRHLRLIMLSAPNWLFLLPGGALMMLGLGIVLWLLPGPVFAGKIGLDVNTISLAMMLILIGMHIFSIGLFVKVFCYMERLSRNELAFVRFLKRGRLEHGLLLGAVLVVIGLIGDAIVVWQWAASGFGRLHAVRTFFFCSLSFFLGIEVVFSSVFLSMLGISRDTYIGE